MAKIFREADIGEGSGEYAIFVWERNGKMRLVVLYSGQLEQGIKMKITKTLTMIAVLGGLLALTAPAKAQTRGNRNGGGNMNRGNFHPGHSRFHNGSRVNFFFGGFGYPFFYGYPYGGYPYYGYPYGYGYPVGAYYSYDPRGIYEGQVVSPRRSTNDGGGKDYSMTARVQRQLAAAGYYRGAIDGIVGDGTRRAIRNYERDNGLRVDGQIDNQLLSTMGLG